MKHDARADAVRSDRFVNYAPAMPNLSTEGGLLSRLARRFGRN
ncbi:hypothetical protein [Halorubrum luteum]